MSSDLITTTELLKEIHDDTEILANQVEGFLQLTFPSYLLNTSNGIEHYVEANSTELLDYMTYFKIASCTTERMDDIREFLDHKMEKFLTAIHSLNVTVAYGIVSHGQEMHLILGIQSNSDAPIVISIMKGLLSGIELEELDLSFRERSATKKHHGLMVGIPSPIIKDQAQTFDLSGIMRSLYGQDYTLMFIAKPIAKETIFQKYQEVVHVRDNCFAISKRNITRQNSKTETATETTNRSETKGKSVSKNQAGAFALAGAAAGAKAGATAGAAAGGIGAIPGAIAGAGLGAMLGGTIGSSKTKSTNESVTEGISNAISHAMTEGESVGMEVQNGLAIELMNYAETAIERLKHAQNSGLWETAITYSASSEISRAILQGALYGEFAKPNEKLLPVQSYVFDFDEAQAENLELLIPNTILRKNTKYESPLASLLNTKELGLLFSLPNDQVPGFELKEDINYPTTISQHNNGNVIIGTISDGSRAIENMNFQFSETDINKHVFVCGITGSGKTTTVKRILQQAKKPFLVIESAKKEYRHMLGRNELQPVVYTLGKPEINCLRMNPFYIMRGVSPQTHIDYLKDLFNAAFSFYGPMPYILETCLHNIYEHKGWNLTLGFHPYIMNTKRADTFFDEDNINRQYAVSTHRLLFPTMQDLKNEVERYIETELQYDGEVAGNIKTAIKARLESLCSGTKGYMFNTNECIDMDTLLNGDVVLELEGLADDADKAFCVGLLVIYINEYRQVAKELSGSKKLGLEHILVIEEAHRLLKNMETERSNGDMGNPKGKAVEHFTNMIAEMRSYGQAVIIAEQIPTKLAPDVIKNSSNKIIHRIVSLDDQQVIANTIGIRSEDAIYLGHMKTGQALCHKEGMYLPMQVQIQPTEDIFRSDSILYIKNVDERFHSINVSGIRDQMAKELELMSIKLLNSICLSAYEEAVSSVNSSIVTIQSALKQRDFHPILAQDTTPYIAELMQDSITELLMSGIYSIKALVSEELYHQIGKFLLYKEEQSYKNIHSELTNYYGENVLALVEKIVLEQLKVTLTPSHDVRLSIRNYFVEIDAATIHKIQMKLEGSNGYA